MNFVLRALFLNLLWCWVPVGVIWVTGVLLGAGLRRSTQQHHSTTSTCHTPQQHRAGTVAQGDFPVLLMLLGHEMLSTKIWSLKYQMLALTTASLNRLDPCMLLS